MRSTISVFTCLAAILIACTVTAEQNVTNLQSQQILASSFTPPQVWKNVNLVRNINLQKSYPRETTNLVILNISPSPQDEYYLPFEASAIGRIGGLEVRDKNDATQPAFEVETVEYDTYSPTQYYRIRLPEALPPNTDRTLTISYSVLAAPEPLPATIAQMDKQYLQYTFSAYFPSAYTTSKQKTKVKFGTTDVPNYTKLSSTGISENAQDPQVQATTFTYGPFNELPAGATETVSVRYEFTAPLNHVSLLERDVEVSHWGGNLAFEERYWLTNRAASLKNHFSRVDWQRQAYYSPPSSSLKEIKVPLKVGSMNPYFVDDIGNVSTSRFRSNLREALLELKPRYPLFGSWNYKFKIGWDQDLKGALRKLKTGDVYVLRVPFLEGPQQAEGVEYERVKVKVVLPEGATNIKFETAVPLISSEVTVYNTFMDTTGRAAVTLTAINLVDDFRDRDLLITYDYPFLAAFRKPLTIVAAVFAIFTAAWLLSRVDVSIGKKKA